MRWPGIKPGSRPWQGRILSLYYQQIQTVISCFGPTSRDNDYKARVKQKKFPNRDSNPGRVGENHIS